MFGMMKGERVKVTGNRMYELKTILDSSIRGQQTDVGGLAAKNDRQVTVMIWNYADKDKQSNTEPVTVNISSLRSGVKKVKLTEYRIDDEHSNSYTVWKKMGSPAAPTAAQVVQLEQAGKLKTIGKPVVLTVTNSNISKIINLPRQGVSLLHVTYLK
jgi:xylan 1,4-beta-xylosidase